MKNALRVYNVDPLAEKVHFGETFICIVYKEVLILYVLNIVLIQYGHNGVMLGT